SGGGSPVFAFPVFSSLSGLDDAAGRAIHGGVPEVDNPLGRGGIAFDYPESEGWTGSLKVNDNELWSFSQGVSSFNSHANSSITSIALVVDGVRTGYTLMYRSGNQCGGTYETLTLTADQLVGGRVRFSDWLPENVTDVRLRPEFESIATNGIPDFIKEI